MKAILFGKTKLSSFQRYTRIICRYDGENLVAQNIRSPIEKICNLTVFNCKKVVFFLKFIYSCSVPNNGHIHKFSWRLVKKNFLTVFNGQSWIICFCMSNERHLKTIHHALYFNKIGPQMCLQSTKVIFLARTPLI